MSSAYHSSRRDWTGKEAIQLKVMVDSVQFSYLDMANALDRNVPNIKTKMAEMDLKYKFDYFTRSIGKASTADKMTERAAGELRHKDGTGVWYG